MKKTKIICTMGPNSDDREVMKQLLLNGMDVARFNFSHGTHDEQRARYKQLREVAEEVGKPVAALLDTKGPEIRTGVLKDGKKVTLTAGEEIILTTEDIIGDAKRVHINYNGLNEDVTEGNVILIDDGLIELHVERVEGTEIYCRIMNGGELGERKGVNVPNVKIKLPALTDKDKEDIRFGIELGFDYIAASFIRSADAIREIRQMLDEGGSPMGIIAKIENAEGLENLDEIIEASDGIMVARGDLGVEIAPEKLPHLQKMMIKKCSAACKVVITATQMLDSMTHNPFPTRAEVSDVSWAIEQGSDAVMLSGESASGEYPIESVNMQTRIAKEVEKHFNYERSSYQAFETSNKRVNDAIAAAVSDTAILINAKLIICFSVSGQTGIRISRTRPICPVFVVSSDLDSLTHTMLYYACYPYHTRKVPQFTEEMEVLALKIAKDYGIEEGSHIIMTGGTPVGAGKTNFMKVLTVRSHDSYTQENEDNEL